MSDEVEGIYRLFMKGDSEPTNIGNPNEFTVRQLAELVVELTGHEVADRQPSPSRPTTRRSGSRTSPGPATMLGWEPKCALRDGVQRTIEYFRKVLG